MTFAPKLSLHESTRALVTAYLAAPHSGVLLSGEPGSGLGTVARAMSESLNPQPGGIIVVTPEDGKDISIEQIRQLYHQTRSRRESLLTVLIDDADHMSIPAQNAFLKLLEEPPAQVIFVLTTHAAQFLLPTIVSRVAAIDVQPISRHASEQLVRDRSVADETMRQQLLFLGQGKPAELIRLMDDPKYFASRAETIRIARSFLQASVYDRLILIKPYLTDRQTALALVRTTGDIAMFGLKKTFDPQAARQLELIAMTIEKLETNANTRLQLLRLALSLGM